MPRYLAIGDIHGCFHALRTLSEFVGFRSDDTIITLGDYVNRGPNTRAVLDWLIRLSTTHNLVPLRGNHEIMMAEARDSQEAFRRWIDVGGDATLHSYSPSPVQGGTIADIPDDHWRFLNEQLVPSFQTETHFFVHANAYPDRPIEDQPDFMLYWESFNDPPRHQSGKIMVCGHTSQKSGLPLTNDNAICIDTWACGQGWLSCLDVGSGMVWQANERGQTRRVDLE